MPLVVESVRVLEGGRIVIPAAMRRALGVKPGDTVLLEMDDGELRVITRLQGIRRAQARLAPYVQGKPSMADELIAERRAEALAEDDD
jgi:AbrB family looped-hinge helix DNA binding protein